MSYARIALVLLFSWPLSSAWAQTENPDQEQVTAQTMAQTAPAESSPDRSHEMGGTSSMDSMAQSLKAMADMCREMMQREMAMMPYKMAAYAFFGLLLTTVLVLLVILQVQWIAYWRRVLKDLRPTGAG